MEEMDGSWSNVVCFALGALTAMGSMLFGAALARVLEPRKMMDKVLNPMRPMYHDVPVVNQEPITSDDE